MRVCVCVLMYNGGWEKKKSSFIDEMKRKSRFVGGISFSPAFFHTKWSEIKKILHLLLLKLKKKKTQFNQYIYIIIITDIITIFKQAEFHRNIRMQKI